MPALGMAQDTGLLVNWLKAPGEAVSAGDPLFEVETDKSTMEVEAPVDGYLTNITAEAGAEVPVGQVIAHISDTADDSGPLPASSDPVDAPVQPTVANEIVSAIPSPFDDKRSAEPNQTTMTESGRILASPKARRVAFAEGLDLNRLVSAGHPQPYHVADIEILRNLPESNRNSPPTSHLMQITASVPRSGTDDFLSWMLEDGGITIAPSALWVSIAAGALRSAQPERLDLAIAVSDLTGTATTYRNPDKTRLLNQLESPDEKADLVLRDLTDSPITGLRLGPVAAPILSIASDNDTLRLSLEFTADLMDDAAAIALISGFSERLANPLLHLL